MTKARDIASAIPAPSTVDATELGYLDGVTSAIQTQLDAKTAKSTLTTTGDIYYASAANTPARLGIGTASQLLAVNSGATAPEWVAAPSSGGMTLISTTTLTGASITLSSIPQTYNSLQIVIRNYKPADDNRDFFVRANGITSNSYIAHSTNDNNGGQQGNAFNTDKWYTLRSDNSAAVGSIIMNFYDYTNTTTNKLGTIFGFANNPTYPTQMNPLSKLLILNDTSALTSLTFFIDTGNFTSGSILLYGVK